jgi:hypothetical protein
MYAEDGNFLSIPRESRHLEPEEKAALQDLAEMVQQQKFERHQLIYPPIKPMMAKYRWGQPRTKKFLRTWMPRIAALNGFPELYQKLLKDHPPNDPTSTVFQHPYSEPINSLAPPIVDESIGTATRTRDYDIMPDPPPAPYPKTLSADQRQDNSPYLSSSYDTFAPDIIEEVTKDVTIDKRPPNRTREIDNTKKQDSIVTIVPRHFSEVHSTNCAAAESAWDEFERTINEESDSQVEQVTIPTPPKSVKGEMDWDAFEREYGL